MSRMGENGAGDKWMHLPLILNLSYQGFQREKNKLFNFLTISLFRKCHSTVVGSAHNGIVLIDCIFTSPEENQSHVFPTLHYHLLWLPFITTPASQLEHLVPSTWPAMVCSIPEMQHNDRTESAGPWRPESVQDKFMACWCSSHLCISLFSFTSAGGYLLQYQPGLPPTAASSAPWSSPLCNYRSNSMDAKMKVSWSMLQLWFQKEVAL